MRLVILFIAIALSAAAFFVTMHLTSNKKDQQMPVVEPQAQMQDTSTVNIYTAKQDIPIGTVITQDMLDFHPWPKSSLLPDMVIADTSHPAEVVKMIVRTPFQKGEPIIMNKLANENDPSFTMAASLAEGMRLVTIPVDAVSGAAGFVFPGDHVDVLITHDVLGETSSISSDTKTLMKEPVTEVLVSNVRVLATNQKSTAHGGDQPVVPATVSIEVTPEDAQKIRLTENGNGTLSVALRALKEKEASAPSRPSALSDLSAARSLPDPGNQQIVIVRGVHADTVGVSRP